MKKFFCFVIILSFSGLVSADGTHGMKQINRKPNDRKQNLLAKTNNITGLSNSFDDNSNNSKSHLPIQKSTFILGGQQATSTDLEAALQDQPEQHDPSAGYQHELRRRQEIRRRQEEEERRRHEEERQRRLDERRRHESERRRLEEDRRRQDTERRRQRQEQERVKEQQSRAFEGHFDSRQNTTRDQRVDRPGEVERPSQERGTSQEDGYRTQHLQSPTGQQSSPGDSLQSPRQTPHRTPTDQQPHFNNILPKQNPGFTSQQGTHVIPNQRTSPSQGMGHHPGQFDHRAQLPVLGNVYPGFRSRYEHLAPGPGQWYQEAGAHMGTYYPYDDQGTYSHCPETGVELRINGLSCQEAVQQLGPHLCYTHEYTSRQCCEVCRPRKQPSKTGCEYGDHASQCSTISPGDCYDLRNRQICCETCHKLRRSDTPPGCEYGDMTDKCDAVRQNPGLCYRPDNQRICCQSCGQARNASNPGCPWGDYDRSLCQMFDDTSNNVRLNCYSHHKRRLCCQSCERLRQWSPATLNSDCQYGDRLVTFTTSHFGRLNCSNILNYFRVEECQTNPAIRLNCCYTCHRYLNGRG